MRLRSSEPSSRHAPAVVIVLGLLTAACGGDTTSTPNTTSTVATTATSTATSAATSTSLVSTTQTPTTTAAPTTTTTAPTTTAAPATTAATATTTAPATTEAPSGPILPLTGTPASDAAVAARAALVVKIDNAPGARPQTGINAADIVFEEIVNGGYTRFALVFHGRGSDPVGPIRSGRLQDIDLLGSFNRPLFAWSGGNATVTAAIRASDLVDIGPSRAAVYFRSNDRRIPHNLYSKTTDLWSRTPFGAPPPPQQFTYRAPDEGPAGAPSPGVVLALDSIDVRWDWDASAGLYRRTMEGRVHDDRASGQVTTNNVVILAVEYLPGISDSPDAQTIGTGEAFVFTGGNYIHGTWSRSNRLEPFTLRADDGAVIGLSPGRTFIELPRYGKTNPLPPG